MADVAVPSVATATPVGSDTVLGVQGGVIKRFPASPPFAQLSATTGAGLVGYSSGEVYAAGTVGAAIEAAAASGATNLSYTASPTNGVVASDTGTDATLSLADGTNAGLLAPADFTKLSNTSGTNTGDETGARIATLLHAATAKTTLVDADEVNGTDSAASFGLIRTTWLNAWVYIKSKADAIYQATLVSGTNIKTINGASVLGSGDLTVTGTGGGTGDVVGPASSVNNHVAFFSGTTGKLIADSGLTLSGSNTGDQTNITGNAATVTTNANLTGDVTSVGNAATVVKINGTSLAGLATGILKNTTTTGVPSIAVAGDFPTLNQSTTGSAATLTTSRNIDGQAFNGSANITVIAPGTHAATGKTTPVDADELPLVDSAASNVLAKLTWANLKATLKTYLDTLYTAIGIVPNTVPSAGQILVGNAGGTAYAPVGVSADATLASTGALTLATVNSNVGSFTSANITVNAKGLVTAAANGTGGSAGLSFDLNGGTASSTTWDFTLNCGASA